LGKFKLSLKLGNAGYLHYFEESEQALNERLDDLLNFRNIIIAKLGTEGNKTQTIVGEPSDYPIIEHASSQFDAIIKAIYTDWARKEPRGLNEIHAALAMNAIHIDKKTLGSRLTALTRQGKIRRIKRNGIYAYTAPLGEKTTGD
jgi:hypothetical protein